MFPKIYMINMKVAPSHGKFSIKQVMHESRKMSYSVKNVVATFISSQIRYFLDPGKHTLALQCMFLRIHCISLY